MLHSSWTHTTGQPIREGNKYLPAQPKMLTVQVSIPTRPTRIKARASKKSGQERFTILSSTTHSWVA
jgi:hypothetical protein